MPKPKTATVEVLVDNGRYNFFGDPNIPAKMLAIAHLAMTKVYTGVQPGSHTLTITCSHFGLRIKTNLEKHN